MIWLALNFYQLPLDIFINGAGKVAAELPLAIVTQGVIGYSNQTAYDKGVEPGIKLASAYALCPQLVVKSRNKNVETKLINQLAITAYQFSSQVCLYSEQVILLEIESSCCLFQRMQYLLKQLLQDLSRFSIHYHAGLGTSAAGSYLLSFQLQTDLRHWLQAFKKQPQNKLLEQSLQDLKQLPIDVLSLDQSKVNAGLVTRLKNMGLKQLDELFNLPTASLERRFGRSFVNYLQQLKGVREEVLVFFEPPKHFVMQLVFIDGLDSVEPILFAAKKLIDGLFKFLKVRRLIAAHLVWSLTDFRRLEQRFVIELSSEVQQLLPLLNLTRLKLDALVLKEKVEVVKLEVALFHCLTERQSSLMFSDKGVAQQVIDDDSFHPLIEQLIVRLGHEQCFSLQLKDHHLPEKHSRLVAFNPAQLKTQPPNICYADSQRLVVADDLPPFQPLWLSPDIKSIDVIQDGYNEWLSYRGRLFFLSSVEKIRDDWSPIPIKRDYYLCSNRQQSFYWIYYDHAQQDWFLQGFF